MAKKKPVSKKIDYMGSLADFKQSVNDSQVDGGGGGFGMLLPGITPSVGNSRGANIMPDVRGESNRYPSPKTPKPADRYPDALPPGRLPRKPVDRYPEATPAKPVAPNKPRKPKKRNFGPSGGSKSQGLE
jgi:hypothetical protein